MSKEGIPHNNTDYEVINYSSIQHSKNINGPKDKISQKPKSRNLEQKLGAETWSRNLEQKLGAETWNRNLEQKLGTETRNRN